MSQASLAKYPLVFTADQTQLLKVYLERLAMRTSSSQVMLVDVSGRLVLSFGTLSSQQSIELAAIGAGSFAAGIEIYKFLGASKGQQFDQLVYEGEPINILSAQVAGELLLIIVFSEDSRIGSVQIYADQVCTEISKLVEIAVLYRQKRSEIE